MNDAVQMQEMDADAGERIGRFLLALALLFPYALGWCVGVTVFVVLWLAAAVVAGYQAGRGNHDGDAQ